MTACRTPPAGAGTSPSMFPIQPRCASLGSMTTATVLASCVDASVDCHDTASVDLLPLLVVVALVVVALVASGIALLGRQRQRRRR